MARSTSGICSVKVTGPLAPFAEAYGAELRERGYRPSTTANGLRQLGRMSCWMEVGGLQAAALNSERVDEFLAWQRAGRRHRDSWSRPALVCLQDVLRRLGVLALEEPARVGSPSEMLLACFERYLLCERGLTAGTVTQYGKHARRFLESVSADGGVAGLTAGAVTTAVLRESAPVSVSAAQCFVVALRAFLRFCFIEGLVGADLSPAALTVRVRRRSSLPRGISRQDAEALLGCCDRRTAIGRRDYAVIITLLRLGLRASEAAALTLDDIDWRAAELVVHGKRSRLDRLPLPADVGGAIASYLRRGRPSSARREVFLLARAAFGPLSPRTVSSIVRLACKRAGVAVVGAHRLRHTLACEMVSARVPLEQIGQVLRHQSPQSTANYARVDLDRLRLLAAPWPGGAGR